MSFNKDEKIYQFTSPNFFQQTCGIIYQLIIIMLLQDYLIKKTQILKNGKRLLKKSKSPILKFSKFTLYLLSLVMEHYFLEISLDPKILPDY